MRRVIALLLYFISGPVFAQSNTNAPSSSSAQFAEQLKDLNARFTKATAERRDYQEIREIRADIKKMIPAIRSKADEAIKQNQADEAEINAIRGQILFFLSPPLSSLPTYAPGAASSAPPLPIFNPDYYANTAESLKRRTEDLRRNLPGQIDIINKEIEQIDKEKTVLSAQLVANDATADQKQAAKDRLDQLEARRQSQFATQ